MSFSVSKMEDFSVNLKIVLKTSQKCFVKGQDDFCTRQIQIHLLEYSYNFWIRIGKNRHSVW